MRDAQGRFLPGPDKDRHALTRTERQRGYRSAMAITDVKIRAWVWRKVRGEYRAKRRARAG